MNNLYTEGNIPSNSIPYEDWLEEDKQRFWNQQFINRIRRSDYQPKDLEIFRKKIVEKNINRFLPWILAALYVFCDSIEDVFILDESAKEYLASRWLTDIEKCFEFIKNTSENINREVQNETNRIIENEK